MGTKPNKHLDHHLHEPMFITHQCTTYMISEANPLSTTLHHSVPWQTHNEQVLLNVIAGFIL